MKLELKLSNDWLEATWYEETITLNDVEKQVGVDDDENPIMETIHEEIVTKTQVHCESFSGHPEHITMLRAKALEFGTELDEELIAEAIKNFKMPTEDELALEVLRTKIAEAKAYLASTDYVTAKYNDEVTVTGSTTKAAFLAKYSDVYAQRAEARAIINMGDA